jgi:phage terminase large subunit-like protein
MWDTSCIDWRERLLAGQSLVPDLPLFTDEADRAVRVFNRLRLPDVIGQPPMAEAAGDWFRDIVRALFGSYDADTNRRQIQELFIAIPKKNGKSSYAAAVMVTALILNRRPNAEYLLIAPTKEIAQISFKQAWGIIKADPELEKLFWARDNIKMITHRNSKASLQIKAADTDVITGSKSTGILVDETHVFAKKPKAADIFVEIRGALAARPDGFMIQITTQSKEPPIGVFKNELAVARDVRDGLVRLPRLAVLYELPHDLAKDGGWKERKYWPLINPNLGRSVDRQFLENELTTAEMAGAEQLSLFASQHFNVEIGLSQRSDQWPGVEYWQAAAEKGLTLKSLLARCDVAVIGADGGGLDDLFGAAVIGREKETRRWLLWAKAWAHPIVLQRRKEIASTLKDFASDGDLVFCTTPTQDIEEFADICCTVRDSGLLPEKEGIGVDKLGLPALVEELLNRGFDVDVNGGTIIGVSQGGYLNPAILGMERKLSDGTMVHAGQPLMAWCVSNAKVELKGSSRAITKQAAGKAKIDPFIAALNAGMLMSRNPEPKRAPTYSMMFVG